MEIPEKKALDILKDYNGSNDQLLEYKFRLLKSKNFSISRPQADYIINASKVKPKNAKKFVKITKSFAEKLMTEKLLTELPETFWCEKLLFESDKAYHIWGKFNDKQKLHSFWIPKTSIIPNEKKLNREIDYSPYSVRPPMNHQKEAIEKLLANDRFILADDMGLAKTGSSVIAALESGAKKILIICPASLKINWQREIAIYSDRRSLVVEGNKWGSTFDFYIINYDILKNYHTMEKNMTSIIDREKFDLAIVDEAHFLSNNTAARTKLAMDILDKIPKVWLLTGTPMTSRPMNYYNLLKIVNSPVTTNWQNYVIRYCNGYQFKVNGRKIWNTSGSSNLDELREVTQNIILRRLKTEVLDLPGKIVSQLPLELENDFIYESEMEEFVRIAKENKENESLSITINRLMNVRQLIANEKIPYTCEIVDKYIENDKKVIIFTNFSNVVDELKAKYGKKAVVVDGRMDKNKRQHSVDEFQNNPKVKVFIGNLIAAGAGLTLTAAECVIMNDLSFVPAHHSQAEDRANRIGQNKSVSVYYPIFENTIEIIIYNILKKKIKIINQVMGDVIEEETESVTKEFIKSLF